jgi:hypothetical protein
MKTPFKTWIENPDGTKAQSDTPAETPVVFSDPVYETPDDVPVPLRHSLAYAYATGITIEELHIIYDNIPKAWIEKFVSEYYENPPLREK